MSTYRTEVFEDGEPCWWCEREALRAELDTEAGEPDPSVVAALAEAEHHPDLEMKEVIAEARNSPADPEDIAPAERVFGQGPASEPTGQGDATSGTPTE
ncbi:hypothetical protein FAM23877_00475 [Propionibacterium freudenreichii]|uniref:hypothetical protein n=1 Tax=Propionibacterium freudenreichii TaxID=1744 RepID=UPI000BC33BDE|nr:hypothetical protein [Propionibacterium freudenreichii]MDK9294141.1 hypothetical protein [Propionibacterium freudenreichii]MDK9359595.1 hypothetical protein [Propionibacterium freudenreichii]MDK9638959.1 hypothetical protein [Propionibacterium freudenreichii]MDK9659910.1 hypothetical protein [Propionibacterium freudenreichii]WGU90477.1 hypothetical protein FAM23877_00475 [Propionibacterium freudenreichii]